MRNAPGFTLIAIASLALGIGANTAIFSVVHTVLFETPPVAQPERIVSFAHHNAAMSVTSPGTPYPDVCEWRRRFRSFEAISACAGATVSLGDATTNEPERVLIDRVNASFFPMLGVSPAMGRNFSAEEDRPGGERVAILSHGLCLRRFGGGAQAIGRTVTLDGESYTVIGVLPPRFRFTGPPRDVYVPLALAENARVAVSAFGRIAPGATPGEMKAELDGMTAATIARIPFYKGWRLTAGPVREWIDPDVRASLLVLLGAVALVLLIVCSNVASLLLARAAARKREIAVRTVLGAGRGRLVRQFVAENIPLAALGSAAGLLLAWWGVRLLPQFDLERIPRLAETRIDGTVLAFTTAASLLTFLLFALAPAISLSRTRLQDALKEGVRGGGAGALGVRLRGTLVVGQVALALLLSVGAVLMIRSVYTLAAVNPGFNPQGVLTASIDLRPGQDEASYRQVIERLEAMPGVISAAVTNSLPLGGNYLRASFEIEGRPNAGEREKIVAVRSVDANYARALAIPVRRGRFFTGQDRKGGDPVAVLNQTAARRLLGDADPIGRRIGEPGAWMTIVGVVADTKHEDAASAVIVPEVLLPISQKPARANTFIVRLDGRAYPEPARFAPMLRSAILSVDPSRAVYRVLTMDRIMSDRLGARRLIMFALAIFAAAAFALAAAGIYGVLSFTVERRRHEIGVRMALGAEPGEVVRMVVGQAARLATAGIAVGGAAALALARLLTTLLYGVSATDPYAFAAAALALAAAAIAAGYVPARRAARVDPAVALRCE